MPSSTNLPDEQLAGPARLRDAVDVERHLGARHLSGWKREQTRGLGFANRWGLLRERKKSEEKNEEISTPSKKLFSLFSLSLSTLPARQTKGKKTLSLPALPHCVKTKRTNTKSKKKTNGSAFQSKEKGNRPLKRHVRFRVFRFELRLEGFEERLRLRIPRFLEPHFYHLQFTQARVPFEQHVERRGVDLQKGRCSRGRGVRATSTRRRRPCRPSSAHFFEA